jgi:DUF2892 family protein
MRVNIGRVDRIVRFVLGVVILGLYGALAPPWKYVTLLGLIPLGTSLTGFCPFYAAIGWNRHRTPTERTP